MTKKKTRTCSLCNRRLKIGDFPNPRISKAGTPIDYKRCKSRISIESAASALRRKLKSMSVADLRKRMDQQVRLFAIYRAELDWRGR